ncbi:MAG: hypothetical protein IH626_03125 [Rhodospirillales bacterium]|nr:hypothetical protein [Rhodospirillales bacterium]
MQPTVESLTPERISDLEAMLEADGLLAEDAKHRDYWLAILADPFRRNSDVLIARSGATVEGMVAIDRRPFGRGDDEGRSAFGWVARERRRQGIGTALRKGVNAHLAARGIPRQLAMLLGGWDDALPFLEANGFTKDSDNVIMGSVGKPYSYTPVEGVRCTVYAGGDPHLNDAIADVQNRAFASEPSYPVVTGELVQSLIGWENSWMVVAIEEATENVVGVVECTHSNVFLGIAVLRRYWGTGLAEWMGGLALDRYAEAGNTEPWTMVRTTNRASLAYLERMNWQQVGTLAFYVASTGSAGALDGRLDRVNSPTAVSS